MCSLREIGQEKKDERCKINNKIQCSRITRFYTNTIVPEIFENTTRSAINTTYELREPNPVKHWPFVLFLFFCHFIAYIRTPRNDPREVFGSCRKRLTHLRNVNMYVSV